jgi:uncharacterized membrane protein YcfT
MSPKAFQTPNRASLEGAGRVDWVDLAKGFCIVFVVMMHSTLGVGEAMGSEGYMHWVVEFARPFRMPDFFLIAGLFLARVIDRDWRTYLDRKVLHFAYFYVLWVTIQFAFKAPGFMAEEGVMGTIGHYFLSFVQPFGTLWFIYLLPVFFVVTKLLRSVSPLIVFCVAAALEIAPVHTGWLVADEFAARYVYFFTGYWLAPIAFRMASSATKDIPFALLGLGAWFVLNAAAVFSFVEGVSIAQMPGISLILGLMGALAVITISALLTHTVLGTGLRYAGERSIVIYLAFFLPMAVTRVVLVKTGLIESIGTISVIVTIMGVVCPLILNVLIERYKIGKFLFQRPKWATLGAPKPPQQRGFVPAE